MPDYRRHRLSGGCYFFTVNALERRTDLLTRHIRIANGERGLWQRRFCEHTIQSERDNAAHMGYVHINPLKHGWIRQVADWPYSSFHSLVKRGVYPEDWAGAMDMSVGEPR